MPQVTTTSSASSPSTDDRRWILRTPTRAAVSSDGRLVAAVGRFSGRNAVQVWDVETGELESAFDVPQDSAWPPLTCPLEFTVDGRLLIGFRDSLLEWDPKTDELSKLLDDVWTFDLNDDDRMLIGRSGLGGNGGKYATVYDLQQDTEVQLSSHGVAIASIALDPTGSIAVTGDIYGNLRVGPANGDGPHLLTRDNEPAVTVAVSPDGRWIASGHTDGSIRLWPMPDLSTPPIHDLPYDEFLAKLKSLTNLRVVPDLENPGKYVVRAAAPFPGWETVPEW